MRKAILLFLFTILRLYAQAQEVTVAAPPQEHHSSHYIGVQLNELIRQIFMFDEPKVSNLYLLTYTMNTSNRWGIHGGLGAEVWTKDKKAQAGSFGFDTTEKKAAVHLRFGVSRVYNLNKKLVAEAGLDIIGNYDEHEIKNNENNTFTTGIPVEKIKTTATTYGGGPCVSLRYNFTTKIALGTEASFYYVTGEEKGNRNNSGGFGSSLTTDATTKINQRIFNAPLAIYFIIKI